MAIKTTNRISAPSSSFNTLASGLAPIQWCGPDTITDEQREQIERAVQEEMVRVFGAALVWRTVHQFWSTHDASDYMRLSDISESLVEIYGSSVSRR